MEKMLLTPEEVAEVLGIGRSTVYNLIGEHLLRSFKIGRSRRVLVSDVQEYVDNLATSSIGQ
ncbi:helix-turn-helix domain-containing protein [Rathayibacter toxicus]|uniref:Helix-turn-helix domain-containing protein n=1 Tax=Rathayibacter toxicus TaxID=145458 RepID=A0A2S5Y533_9MICO|nr:helix-turn-helix domain-containing protein [Rathayibacter toxicus]PPH21701.1 helix-turn-helix domain-containing protein [Rathayibacter toxicus]PPH56130.1 helix-turn-helix domain-containing protein [Rathayibacter toxicus]PPH58226.1 helix-turn-helix domain-containing protein [Rathayibacter toxicus]PPH85972.1 helix-turn-helix domain-containing protein [Rathayibacter toxicus]PPI13856.1 helix-turn-helix domain-containing protein [Rathayibacter toxicus]